eukprot:11174235-Lingulodinium_polyedra.AAC.1
MNATHEEQPAAESRDAARRLLERLLVFGPQAAAPRRDVVGRSRRWESLQGRALAASMLFVLFGLT